MAKGSQPALQGAGRRASREYDYSSPGLCLQGHHLAPKGSIEFRDLLRIEFWKQEKERKEKRELERVLLIQSSQDRPQGLLRQWPWLLPHHRVVGQRGEQSLRPKFKSRFNHLGYR